MLTIESLLFAALGFLVAGLLTIVTAPLFWARAVRLTTRDIKSRMALTEREIEADRGRMRAEHAVLVHGLESRLATLRNHSDHARVEINRRDAKISELSRELEIGREALETSENARRVLERTIVDRVPDVERHLRDARSELTSSEAAAQKLRAQVAKTLGALDEALDINDQQRAEISRLKSRVSMLEDDIKERDALHTGQPRTSDGAIRAELAALRAKSRDQASLIERLQRAVGNGDRSALPDPAADVALGVGEEGASTAASQNLQAIEAKQRAAEGRLADRDRQIRVLEAEVSALREIATQNLETARLHLKSGDGDVAEGRSPAAMAPAAQAAVDALEDAREQRVREQEQTIKRLRAELAASNDRLARELAKMKDELRRYSQTRGPRSSGEALGAPRNQRAATLTRRVVEDVPEVLRTANGNGRVAQPPPSQRPPSVDSAPAPVASTAPTPAAAAANATPVALGARISQSEAAAGKGTRSPAQTGSARSAETAQRAEPVSNGDAVKNGAVAAQSSAQPQASGALSAPTEQPAPARRRGLLARISEIDRNRS